MAQEQVAEKAEFIANDKLLREGFEAFGRGKGYFITKNPALTTTRKPTYFPVSSNTFLTFWKTIEYGQKKYLLILAGLSENAMITESSYQIIKTAYKKWNSIYYPCFYGNDASWACNLFVGEALYLAGLKQMQGNKYYSAKQIWNGAGNFKEVSKKEVKRGDVVAFGGHHVEIVTKVNRGQWFYDDDFCSRGAGRNDNSVGTEKCDSSFGTGREIDDKNIKFFRVKP